MEARTPGYCDYCERYDSAIPCGYCNHAGETCVFHNPAGAALEYVAHLVSDHWTELENVRGEIVAAGIASIFK